MCKMSAFLLYNVVSEVYYVSKNIMYYKKCAHAPVTVIHPDRASRLSVTTTAACQHSKADGIAGEAGLSTLVNECDRSRSRHQSVRMYRLT